MDKTNATQRAWWASQSDIRIQVLYRGAWDANDADQAASAKHEMVRRGMSAPAWPTL